MFLCFLLHVFCSAGLQAELEAGLQKMSADKVMFEQKLERQAQLLDARAAKIAKLEGIHPSVHLQLDFISTVKLVTAIKNHGLCSQINIRRTSHSDSP